MKHVWFASIVILSASLLSAASSNPRPNEHQKAANKETQTAKPLQPEPTVPQRNLDAAQAATLDALRALHAEQEARAGDNRANHEAHVANRISLGLLIVGVVYSFFAWKQWAAIKEQAKIAEEALTMDVRPRVSVKIEHAHAPLALTGKDEQQFIIYYKVRNTGRGPAFITRQNQCFFYLTDPNDPLPTKPPESPHDTPIGGIITGGDEVPCDVCSTEFSSETFDRIGKGLTRAFWMVLIEYRDERGQPHVYREPSMFEPGSGRWVYPPNAPDSWSQST